jgi:replicative DNA helicase
MTTTLKSAPAQAAPPHSLEAEQAVLGSVLLDAPALAGVEGTLESGHFHFDRHRHIFDAMINLADRGQSIDMLTLTEELDRRGTLEAVGGRGYLAALPQAVVSPENVSFHADIVRRKARLRSLITAAREILDEATAEREDADQIVDAAEQRLFAIGRESAARDFAPMTEIIHRTLDEIDRAQSQGGRMPGLSTGFADLDRMTLGLHPSDLIVVAGRPAMGKTSFALNIALNVALAERKAVGVFSLEMSTGQVSNRMLCTLAKVPSTATRSGRLGDSEAARLDKEARNLDLAPLWIDDTPGQTVYEIRSKARRLALREKNLGLIIVDYLQLMSGSGRIENRQQEIAEITRALKGLARDLEIPIMALSQLSRKVEDRRAKDRRPILSDLRESGAIEQDADLVIFLHRPAYYEQEREADFQDTAPSETEVILAKHRNGPTGTVQVLFFRRFTRFETMLGE